MRERPEPDPFHDSFSGLIAARALTTGVLLGVFDALEEQALPVPELARQLGADALGLDALTGALLALGYLERDGELLRNASISRTLLVRSSPNSIATFVGGQGELHWQVLARLPEAVRGGEPFALHERRRHESEHWEAYIRGLYEISRTEQSANAALVPLERARRLVDVAGGHGGFAMAMCRRYPELEATVLDLPPSAAVGREIVAEEGFADRVRFRAGDVFELGLGDGLDVVSAFNLAHHLPEERDRRLCELARAALRPGGCLVIGDSAPPEPGEQVPDQGAVSSLLFFAWSGGRNFRLREIVGWMEDAGFAGVSAHRNEVSPWRVVVIGRAGAEQG